jgi:peptidoglycan/LPS O-acetylase OafA/YrhL
MRQKQRLTGIDTLRGIAIFAVVILHSDEGITNLPSGWSVILQFSSFAVPFFLAASFYFAITKLYDGNGNYSLRPRLVRLLIPYGLWSAVYLLRNVARYSIGQEPENLQKLVQDPAALTFLGGTAFHLYFIPLLLCGTVLLKLAERLTQKPLKLTGLLGLLLLSTGLYQLLISTGNAFQLTSYRAFESLLEAIWADGNQQPVLRLTLVGVAWMVRCLPYICAALLLGHPQVRTWMQRSLKPGVVLPASILVLLLFLLITVPEHSLVPEAIRELMKGYFALLLGIFLSTWVSENPWTRNLGACSFGIYLVHLFIVEVFQSVGKRIAPTLLSHPSTLMLLGIATLSFLISWAIAALLMQKKVVSKWLFGV